MNESRFHTEVEVFKEGFEAEFVDFFTASAVEKNSEEDRELLQDFAAKLYKNIFNLSKELDSKKGIKELSEYGIRVENTLILSLLFLLKNFMTYIKKEQKDIEFAQKLTQRVYEYFACLEKETCCEADDEVTHISFGTSENIVFGTNIIDHFRDLKRRGEEVTFFNLYQGVPICNRAKILDIEGESVAFQTARIQEIAMKLEGIAYILKDENFDKHVRANIVYNNFLNNSVTLNNFTYMLNMPASQREFIRVHPNIMAFVTLQDNEDDLTTGKLYDLSTDGLGVVGESKNGLYVGADIQISFEIGGRKIKTRGELVNIIEYKDSYRFCVQITPKIEEKNYIKEYVSLREKEILEELHKHLEDYGL